MLLVLPPLMVATPGAVIKKQKIKEKFGSLDNYS